MPIQTLFIRLVRIPGRSGQKFSAHLHHSVPYCPAKPRTPATIRSLGNGQSEFFSPTGSEELSDLVAQATDLVRDTAKNAFAVCLVGDLFNWDHRPVRKSVPASCKSKPELPHFQRSISCGDDRSRTGISVPFGRALPFATSPFAGLSRQSTDARNCGLCLYPAPAFIRKEPTFLEKGIDFIHIANLPWTPSSVWTAAL